MPIFEIFNFHLPSLDAKGHSLNLAQKVKLTFYHSNHHQNEIHLYLDILLDPVQATVLVQNQNGAKNYLQATTFTTSPNMRGLVVWKFEFIKKIFTVYKLNQVKNIKELIKRPNLGTTPYIFFKESLSLVHFLCLHASGSYTR
jgi:hypothetical protein